MYKVFAVDDEPSVIEGLKLMIPWSTYGFELCGYASDAREALQKIEEIRPHLVITDIRMPQKSGLEMIHEVRELGLDVEFVILSGYSEFSYAQQAIRSRVLHYLLKPVDREEVVEVLLKIKNRLDQSFLTQYGFTREEVEGFKNHRHPSRPLGDHSDKDGNSEGWWKPFRENFDEELTRALEQMNRQEAIKLIDEMFTFFISKEIGIMEAQIMVNSCIYHILRIAYERNIRLNSILYHAKSESTSFGDMIRHITDILCKTIDLMLEDRRRNSKSYLYNVKAYIDNHFDEELTVAFLAEREYLEAGYLGEAFIRQFGCSINEYQHRLRIQKAIQMMKDQNRKLSDIAAAVGYNNYNNFFTHFEKITGKKPTQFLNQP